MAKAMEMSQRQIREMNERMYGAEPASMSLITMSKLAAALTWYNVLKERTDAAGYLIDYAQAVIPNHVEAIKAHVETSSFTPTQGWVAKLVLNKCEIPSKTSDKLAEYVAKVIAAHRPREERVVVQRTSSTDRKLAETLDAIDAAIDSSSPFDMHHQIDQMGLSQTTVRAVAAQCQRYLDDIEGAINKTDEQLVEGYHHLSLKTKKAMVATYTTIIGECDRHLGNVRKMRKPKKKKAPSVAAMLKHFKYLEKSDPLNIASINPTSILGAASLFTLNTSTNVMTIYYGLEGGLGIHRSSITNYDPAKTRAKRVGKRLAFVIETVLKGSKKMRHGVLDIVKSDDGAVTDRINTNVILLKAEK